MKKENNAGGGELIKKSSLPKTAAKLGLSALGLGLGSFVMKKVPDFGQPMVKRFLPGVAGIGIAVLAYNKVPSNLKPLLIGLGIAGATDLFVKNVAPLLANVPFLSDISSSVPSLSGGVGPQTNTGDYPPSYYFKNTFQGPGAYALNGKEFSMQGSGAYALNGFSMQGAGAYALN